MVARIETNTVDGDRPGRGLGGVRLRRASYLVTIALGVSVLLGMAAFAIDIGYLQLAALQAQNAADAGAHAAMVELKAGGTTSDARTLAEQVMARHHVAGEPVQVAPADDIQFGDWDFATRTFASGTSEINAVQVGVRRTSDSPMGRLTMPMGMFAPQLDLGSPTPAVAAVRPRDIVVVMDVTGSFSGDIDEAAVAAVAMVDFLDDSGFPNDRLAMIQFTGDTHWDPDDGAEPWVASPWTELSYVQNDATTIRDRWATLDWCYKDGATDREHIVRCEAGHDGTNPGAGLEDAIDLLLAQANPYALKVIVLVSDGEPSCYPKDNPDCDVDARTHYAYDMADLAGQHAISIFSVSFNPSYSNDQHTFLRDLTRGFGTFYEAHQSENLEAIMVEIVSQVPVALVE